MTDVNAQGKNTPGWLFSLCCLVILAIVTWYSFESQLPSPDKYTAGDATAFSQQNVLKHLNEISKKPHYLGSPAHAEVRQYLLDEIRALGLEVETFTHMATHARRHFTAANTQNIIAKIPGASGGDALALLSHYDSAVHSSLGASDAGSGVATILEGIRSYLASGETPQNDIIIILSDGEERGLLGAQAFVNYHPWAKEVKVVLNFEARGSGGPSYMLVETNGGNAELIAAFTKAKVAHPAANSLMYSIYKLLPNDTDLTIFREDGDIQGYNFAFIDDHFDYHTVQDSVARLDRDSLNHHAEYLLALLDYFADADLSNLKSEQDSIYFNVPVFGMLVYPFAWVFSMAVFGAMLLLPIIYIGIQRQQLSAKGIAKSFVPLSLSITCAGLIGYLGWQALLSLFPHYGDIPQNFTYNGHWIIASFVALTVATTLGIYHALSAYCPGNNKYVAPIVLWLLVNLYIAQALAGAGFLILPTYFALTLLGIKVLGKGTEIGIPTTAGLAVVLSVPALVIIGPLISAFVIGLGLNTLFIGTLLTCLLLILILPALLENAHSKALKYLALTLALVFFTVSAFQSSYSPQRKKPNSINYVLDVDQQQAFWISSNLTMDEFTQQFFSKTANAQPWDNAVYPDTRRSKVRHYQQAEVLPLAYAQVVVEKDRVVGTQRHISLSIAPNRASNLLRLYSLRNIRIESMSVNGQVFQKYQQVVKAGLNAAGVFFSYTLSTPLESLVIDFTVPASEPLAIKLYESAFDLYEVFPGIQKRSALYMPEPFMLNDSTIIGQKVKLPSLYQSP